MKDFHCCATCIHFQIIKAEKKLKYVCSRLKNETKPNYKFNCWYPKDNVKKLMNKEN